MSGLVRGLTISMVCALSAVFLVSPVSAVVSPSLSVSPQSAGPGDPVSFTATGDFDPGNWSFRIGGQTLASGTIPESAPSGTVSMPDFGQSQAVSAEVTVPWDGSTWIVSDSISFVAPPPPGGGGGGGGGGNGGYGHGGGGGHHVGNQNGGGGGSPGQGTTPPGGSGPGPAGEQQSGDQATPSAGNQKHQDQNHAKNDGKGAGASGQGPDAPAKKEGPVPHDGAIVVGGEVIGAGAFPTEASRFPLVTGAVPALLVLVAALLWWRRRRSWIAVSAPVEIEGSAVGMSEPWDVRSQFEGTPEPDAGPWEVRASLQEFASSSGIEASPAAPGQADPWVDSPPDFDLEPVPAARSDLPPDDGDANAEDVKDARDAGAEPPDNWELESQLQELAANGNGSNGRRQAEPSWEIAAQLQEIDEDERGPRWEVEAELQEIVGEERARSEPERPGFDEELERILRKR